MGWDLASQSTHPPPFPVSSGRDRMGAFPFLGSRIGHQGTEGPCALALAQRLWRVLRKETAEGSSPMGLGHWPHFALAEPRVSEALGVLMWHSAEPMTAKLL